ncbi:MAG: hypothetical protein H9W83_08675 [Leuconostoc sp.]|nr:hypothetical protein [Leuconostoc sp.]
MSNVLVKSEAIDEVDLDVSGMGQVVIHGKVGKKMVDRSAMAKIEFMG